MGLSNSERREIEDLIRVVFKQEFQIATRDITLGFVEAIDWYTDNLATILIAQNERNDAMAGEFKEKIARMLETPAATKVRGFK